jgi:hypothetical protein
MTQRTDAERCVIVRGHTGLCKGDSAYLHRECEGKAGSNRSEGAMGAKDAFFGG